MVDTYKGDSPNKKVARYSYWSGVATDWLGYETFVSTKHLVLASREGGDIACLLSLRVPKENIVAVDREQSAVDEARRRWPGVAIICDDALAVAKRYRRSFGSILLDYCSQMRPSLLETTFSVAAHGLKDRGVLGVSFLAGREFGESREQILEEKKKFADYVAACRQDLVANPFATDKLKKDLETIEDRTAYSIRVSLIRDLFVEGLRARCISAVPVAFLYYLSHTRTNKGVPIVMSAVATVRPAGISPYLFVPSRLFTYPTEEGNVRVRPDLLEILDDPSTVQARMVAMSKESPYGEEIDWPLSLNLTKQQWAAWKAHYTMGTYGDSHG